MRARSGVLVGWVFVVAYATLLVVAAVDGAQDQAERPTGDNVAADRFVMAWERSRLATFVATGTFERRREETGARVASADVVAQRPPRRVHRQLGGVDGRDDDRLLVCPAPPDGGEGPGTCRLGDPGGPTYAESVDAEVQALGPMVAGRTPLYTVQEVAAGCFALEQIRVEPRAPFGLRARFCFDGATGAPSARRVEYEGGIVEELEVTDIRATVQDADLVP